MNWTIEHLPAADLFIHLNRVMMRTANINRSKLTRDRLKDPPWSYLSVSEIEVNLNKRTYSKI